MDRVIEKKPVKDLVFDPNNPRLPTSRRNSSEQVILEHMIDKENVFDLIGSIGEQGYFPGEPLLVVPSSSREGMFEVVEGNRRLAALMLLKDPDKATIKRNTITELVRTKKVSPPNEVEVIVFKERNEILDYLGYRHITGVDQWDSLAKARYLTQLRDFHKNDYTKPDELYKHLAKLIGSRTDYVKKLIGGYMLYEAIAQEDYYDIPNLNEESFSFSLLTTAVSYSNISDFVEIKDDSEKISFSLERLKELTQWLFKEGPEGFTRVPESRDIRKLNSVVASAKALEVFRNGRSLYEAEIFTDEPRKTYEKLINDAYGKLKLANESLHQVEELDQGHVNLLKDLASLARQLFNSTKEKVEKPDIEEFL
jgi:hypothetical protein